MYYELVRERRPAVVGLSVMTFQRSTAFKIARLLRSLDPSVRIVAGGYDPSLAPDEYEPCAEVDFIVELDRRQAREQRAKQRAHLHPGQLSTNTEMSAESEREVTVGVGPGHVEAMRIVEDAGVAIGGEV